MKIANKISLSFFFAAVILVMSAATFTYHIEKENLKTVIYNHLITTAQSRAHHVETFLNANKETVRQLSKSVVITRFLLTGKENENYGQRLNDTRQKLKDTSEVLMYYYSLFILDKDGMVVVSSEEADVGLDKSTSACFLGAKKGVFIKDVYISSYGKTPSLAFSAPITDSGTGEFLGVIIGKSKLEGLNKITTDMTALGETGNIYLVNKHGYIITPSCFKEDILLKLKVDNENTRKAFEDIEKFGTEEHLHVPLLYTNYRGMRVLGTHDHIHLMQWVLMAEIDEKEALAPLGRIKFLLISIIIITPILAWLIGGFVSRIISRPIQALYKGSEIIGSGNLDYKVGTDAKDEIGQFSRAFDEMAEDLKKTVVSRDYVDNIISSIADILVVVTPDGKIEKVNKAALSILGYNEQELIGKDVNFLFPEEEGISKGTNLEKFITEGALEGSEVDLKTKDGKKIPVLLSGALIKTIDCPHEGPTEDCPVYKEKGMHCEKILSIVCVAKDITKRKKAEEELREAYTKLKETQNQLIESEKLASLGKFVVGMAHEVNNPLMIISGRAQVSLMERIKDKKIERNLKIIVEQCERTKNIIQRMLTFSKPGKREFAEVDINKPLEDTIKLIEHQYSLANIRIIKKYMPSPPMVKIDEQQMQEVFINLLNNSSDAMPKGGTITISTFKKDNNMHIDFKDTGEGIKEEDMRRLFEPFFTTKKKGAGLGLSVCYGIIKSHNGELRYKSKPGKGTAATIVLPLKGK